MEASIYRLHLNKAGGHVHLIEDHIKKWLREAYLSERTYNPLNPDIWGELIGLAQYMWQHVEIPAELIWTILVLVPNLNTDTWGVGLLETFWKVVEAIIDTRIKACSTFHEVLHGFCAGRGM